MNAMMFEALSRLSFPNHCATILTRIGATPNCCIAQLGSRRWPTGKVVREYSENGEQSINLPSFPSLCDDLYLIDGLPVLKTSHPTFILELERFRSFDAEWVEDKRTALALEVGTTLDRWTGDCVVDRAHEARKSESIRTG